MNWPKKLKAKERSTLCELMTMEIEINPHEIGEQRYGVVMVTEYNGEKTGVLGKYKTIDELVTGYALWATELDEMKIKKGSYGLHLVEFNERGEMNIRIDLLLEIYRFVENKRIEGIERHLRN